jgi:hypothetical protein
LNKNCIIIPWCAAVAVMVQRPHLLA